MYIAPRPLFKDDPNFPLRVAVAAIVGLMAAVTVDSAIPVFFPTICFGMLASQREAFHPIKSIAGPIVMILLTVLMSWLITLTRPMPLVLISVLFLIFFTAYYLILRTGNPMGMLILIVAVLTSVMGMYSIQAMNVLVISCVEACVLAMLVIPVLYYFFPSKSSVVHVPVYTPAEGDEYAKRALIRASVMLLLSFWLYTVLDVANLIYAIAAIFVTVFPTRSTLFREVKERVVATCMGGILAVAIIGLYGYVTHLPVVMCLLLLSAFYFGTRMMNGRHPPMVYQFSFSVTIALVVGALSTQAPWGAAIFRILLTVAGALSAAVLTSILELLFLRETPLEY